MQRFAELVLALRAPLTALAVAVVVVAVAWLPHSRLDFSIEPLIEGDADQRQRVASFHERLPPPGVDLIVSLTWPSPLRVAELSRLAEVEQDLLGLRSVGAVESLASVRVLERVLGVPIPTTVASLIGDGTVADVVARHPILHRTLLSVDGRSTVVLIKAQPAVREAELLHDVETLLARVIGDEATVRMLGSAPVERTLGDLMLSSMRDSALLELLLFALLAPLLFRSVRGVLLPLLVVLVAITLDLGLMAALGLSITVLDVAIPGLITILGLCDAVHMLHRFEVGMRAYRDRSAAIVDMLRHVGVACFHTSFTTALGFLSLLVARHESVREFALKASMAVGVTWLTVMLLMPLGLAWWPVRRAAAPVLENVFDRVSYGRRRLTLLVAVVVVAASVWGASRIRVESRWLEELPADDPAVAAVHWFGEHFTGPLHFTVQLEGDLASAEAVAAVDALRAALIEEPGVTTAHSYVDWLREIAGPERSLDADSVTAAVRILRALGDEFPGHLVDRDMRNGRLTFRTGDLGTQRFLELEQRVTEAARPHAAVIRAEAVSYTLMAHQSSRLIIVTLLQSFAVSLLAITVFVSVIYRSWRLGLVSMLPNVLPITVALGLTGWLDIPVRVGIVMIYCLGLGLAVDDSIHVLTRFRQEQRADPGAPVRTVLLRTLRCTGRALLVTSVIMAAGALSYLPTDLRSTQDVGVLLTAVVLTALIADLWLLPVLVESFLGATTPGPRVSPRTPAPPRAATDRG